MTERPSLTAEHEIRNHRGTVVATIRLHDELPPIDWLTLKGRSFFWEADKSAFVELPPDDRGPSV